MIPSPVILLNTVTIWLIIPTHFTLLTVRAISPEADEHCFSSAASEPAGEAAPQPSSLPSKGGGLLGKLKMSAELLITLAALLSWAVVGVVMFDFVEYKSVPGRSPI